MTRSRTGDEASRIRDAAGGRTRTILVVDDDRHSREGLRDALLQDGYEVETAADAWQAMTTLCAHTVEVAIVDLDLPPFHGVRLDGADIVRILRACRPEIDLIIISAEDEVTLRRDARALSIVEVLEKPISPAHVRAIVRALEG